VTSVKEKICEYLKGRSEPVEDLLCRLIGFKSTAGEEKQVQEFLYDYLSKQGFQPEFAEVDEDIVSDEDYTRVPGHETYSGRPNLLVHVPGSGGGRSAILNSHCDVVPAPKEMFTAHKENGVVYGRGACDAKGQVVSILLALETVKALGLKLKGDLQVQIVIEEESGGNGALSVIRQGHKADCAIIMEPTTLKVHPANRGAVWYKLSVSGKSAHMGKYWEGVNAIKEMAGLIGILKEYETNLRQASAGNPLFPHDPSPVNVNIGKIEGGDWPSTVAEECYLEGGIAFLPNRRIQQIHEELNSLIRQRASEWARDHYSLEFTRLHNEAFETPVDHPAVQSFDQAAARVLGKEPLVGFIASCDARLFARRGEMPTITFGPGELGHAHSLNERVKTDDILRAAEVLVLFLTDWCGVSEEKK
jgi:acetylornithine deacetylase